MQLYNKMPVLLQNLICSLDGYKKRKSRYNRKFYEYLEQYEKNNKLSSSDISRIQSKKIIELISHCYNNVPYYRRMFDDNSIDYKQIDSVEKLEALPILTKDIVRDNYHQLLAENITRDQCVQSKTSGTTGSGFAFLKTKQSINEQWAVWWRFRRLHGIQMSTWCAHFSSNPIVPAKQHKPPYWRINYPGKQILFSAFHMKDSNLLSYVEEIKRRKIIWIHGFPSVVAILANYIIANRIDMFGQIKHITTGGESLLEYQKQAIERAFGSEVFEHYGLAEGVANISQNEKGEFEIDSDFCAVEFYPNNGTHKIIGTNLSNYAMPLLRYDTQDLATIVETKQGRKILSIDGRIEDYLLSSDGRKFGRISRAFMYSQGIIAAQVVQNVDYSIDINLSTSNAYGTSDEKKILDFFRNAMNFTHPIRINYGGHMIASDSGKHRLVINKVCKQHFGNDQV